MFYYLEIQVGGKTLTKPYDKTAPIQVYVDDGSILGDPSQITMTPDTTQGNLRFSWVTVPEVSASVVQYKKQGGEQLEDRPRHQLCGRRHPRMEGAGHPSGGPGGPGA